MLSANFWKQFFFKINFTFFYSDFEFFSFSVIFKILRKFLIKKYFP